MTAQDAPTITSDFNSLLPADELVAENRNDVRPAAIVDASSLRIAAFETVREGYLLHHGEARYYRFDDDDLALLAGDRLYASGLEALAHAHDLEAVTALSELIAGCAEAQARSNPADADRLWATTLAMLAPGSARDNEG